MSKQVKHTPGPWTLNLRRNLLTIEPHICNMRKSSMANANLIKTAPLMLELLKRFPDDSPYSDAVRIAIAKAEGRE